VNEGQSFFKGLVTKAAKVFPAMLVGCTVVLKPSEAYGNFQKFLS